MSSHAEARQIVESLLPGLATTGYRITSPADRGYNCIAWAAGDTGRWWWPVDRFDLGYFWPEGAPKEETVAAFLQAFATLGYAASANDALEPGLEKIALYALHGEPTHAARQLDNGLWTSKLGKFIDVEHRLEGLSGSQYGQVVQILQRSGRPAAAVDPPAPP
jgi:hypothetical protein